MKMQFHIFHFEVFRKARQRNYLAGILVTLRVLFENMKADHIIYLPGPEKNEETSTVDLQEFTLGSLSIIEREWFTRFDSYACFCTAKKQKNLNI